MREFLTSLRFRVLALVAIGAIPGILTITFMGLFYRQQARLLINTQAINLTRLVVAENKRQLEETRNILAVIAQIPAIKDLDVGFCNPYLAEVLAQGGQALTSLALADADGQLLCMAPVIPEALHVSTRQAFEEMRARGEFAVGIYQLDLETKLPIVSTAYPIFDGQGEVRYALLATIDLSWLNELAAVSELPEGFTLLLADLQGTVLTRFPDPEVWRGKNIFNEPLFQNMRSQAGAGTLELSGLDGDQRLYAFNVFQDETSGLKAYLSLGFPYAVAFAKVDQTFLLIELALVLISGFTLAAAWVGGSFFVINPINILIRATQRLAEGDLSARTQLPYHTGELRKLSLAFDQMVVALEQREADRQIYEEALREHERTLATLMNNLPGMAYRSRNDPHWTKVFVSEGSLALTAYAPEAFLGDQAISVTQLIHPEDRTRVWEQVQLGLQEARGFTLEYRLLTAHGEEKWVLEKGQKVLEQDGQIFLEGFMTDITPQKQAEAKIKRQLAYLTSLRAIDLAIMGSLDLRLTLEVILEQVAKNLAASAVIYLYHTNGQKLTYGAYHGSSFESAFMPSFSLGEGLIGKVGLEQEPFILLEVQDQQDFRAKHPSLSGEGFNAYAAIPLLAKGNLQGVLEVFHHGKEKAQQEWVDFLIVLAGQTAIAINSAHLFDNLQQVNRELMLSYEATLEGWALALELRDQETEGHSKRVTQMTEKLAKSMGIPTEDLRYIRWGALLHDIGKIGIPDHILLKPGKLTEEEWGIMKLHPVYAYNLLSKIHFLGRALEIPYGHHERWNGSGYPRGLAGDQIPFSARIFMVVDVWDALSYDRPYRAAWPQEKVIAYLQEEAGILFDPQIVTAFIELLHAQTA